MKRDKAIAAAVARGETFKDIGDRYGLTRERVRQIAHQRGVQSTRSFPIIMARAKARRQARDAARRRKQQAREAIIKKMKRLVKGGMSILAAGRRFGLTPSKLLTISRRGNLGAFTRHGRWRWRYE